MAQQNNSPAYFAQELGQCKAETLAPVNRVAAPPGYLPFWADYRHTQGSPAERRQTSVPQSALSLPLADRMTDSEGSARLDGVGLERLAPADHSQVHAAARLHRGRDCTKAQVTPHLIRREGKLSVGRITPAAEFSDKRVQDQLGMGQTEVETHATPMPRRSHSKGQWHPKIHVNPDNTEPHQRHSSLARVQDQLGRGQTKVEIHATAMPRPEDAPLPADPSPLCSGADTILDY
ncbi:hypothetical protein BGZ57DRAFT_853809 [Hyaloscypha finlandica]|nr:hypothetical protein BGZ57DRAFT_853809 [Hyaloscypha finlandica]